MTDATLIILGTLAAAQTAIRGCILLELREQRITRTLRESKRRAWIRKEHEG